VRQEPFQVIKGDSFISKFWFRSNGTKFGKSSDDEMMKTVFVYYPAVTVLGLAPWSCVYNAPVAVCNSSLESRSLVSVGETERIFGKTPPQCQAKATLSDGNKLGPWPNISLTLLTALLLSFTTMLL
jgi:hypothetical protein